MSWHTKYWIRFASVLILCPIIDVGINNLLGISGTFWDWAFFIPFYLISYYTFVYRYKQLHQDRHV
jgi:hypothetical protein